MILQKLSILNYKNIKAAELSLSPGMNCFIGSNGAGKTNVIDAVYYLSFCRSALCAVDSQVMRHGEAFFMLEGSYQTDGGDPLSVYCGMKRGTKKHMKRDGKEYRRLSEHIGLVPLVSVSPADSLLIDGGSEERRRLMDIVISQYDRAYLDSLGRYNKALAQRNAMLRADAVEREDPLCIELVMQAGSELGHHIAGLINIFNPEVIVIGGNLAQAEPCYFLQPIELAVRKYSLKLMSQNVSIITHPSGADAAVLGACLIARSRVAESEAAPLRIKT